MRYKYSYLVALIAATIYLLVSVSALVGLEITDEGYYLLLEEYPENFHYGTSIFGILVNPIYEVFGGNFVVLRVISVTIFFALATYFFYELLSFIGLKKNSANHKTLSYSISLASSVFFVYSVYVLTPSYNSVTLQTLILYGILIFQLLKEQVKNKVFVEILIGADLVLIAVSKPTTGIVIFVLTVLLLVGLKLSSKFRISFWTIILGGISTLFLLFVWMNLQGSSLIDFFVEGSKLQQAFNPRYSILNMIRTDFDFVWIDLLSFSLLFTFALGAFSQHEGIVSQRIFRIALLANVIFLCAYFANTGCNLTQTPVFLYGFFGVAIYCLKLLFSGRFKSPSFLSLVLVFLFLVLPWAYVFGTNNNYLIAEIQASIFWIAASLLLFFQFENQSSPIKPSILNIYASLIVISVCTTLIYSFSNPYRQAPTSLNNTVSVQIGIRNTTVLVPDSFGIYVNKVKSVAQKAGLLPGTQFIDLTGESPGTVFLLGGKTIYQPWLIGGYPGSNSFAEKVLFSASCSEINQAWVLYSEDNNRNFDPSLLSTINLSLENDYELVGEFQLPDGFGSSPEGYRQYLYKPKINRETVPKNCSIN